MHSTILDYLDEIIAETSHVDSGSLPEGIPELAAADPDRAAVALCTVNGTVYASGDAEDRFSIQSMSKPFAYALAIEDRGFDAVLERIGVEPSGEAFDELSLEPGSGRPANPMINAGAIAAHALVRSDEAPAVDRLLALFSRLAQRPIEVDESLAASEIADGERDRDIARLLRAADLLPRDPSTVAEGYVRQCSAVVTVRDLALMASTLANGGVQPDTGERLFSRRTTKHVLSVMASCGMYDAAGDWLTSVGIPAKSGVSGGIIGVLPGQIGVAVRSPRLDPHGHSVRGIAMMEHLSDDLGLHLMEVGRPARSSLRETRRVSVEGRPATVYTLQGDLGLSGVESLVHEIVDRPPRTDTVVLDMSRVTGALPIARRTTAETAAKLVDEGREVVLVDAEETVPEVRAERGRAVERWTSERLEQSLLRDPGESTG
ncbi:glutaminase A [Nocardiopsis ganjiahuensis]|uniref:glutaminase A n=1 Tax=Nocardiopsis ganjiahuensis TaxID=239984 RepID=UPI0003495C3D|nr:glutaminase A [Nocardiopsis ganjiahuensis]